MSRPLVANQGFSCLSSNLFSNKLYYVDHSALEPLEGGRYTLEGVVVLVLQPIDGGALENVEQDLIVLLGLEEVLSRQVYKGDRLASLSRGDQGNLG